MDHKIRPEILANICCTGDGHLDCPMEINAQLYRKNITPTKKKMFEQYNNNSKKYLHPNQKVKYFFYEDKKTRAITCRKWVEEDKEEGYLYSWTCCCNSGFIGFQTYFEVKPMTAVLRNLSETLLPISPPYGCGCKFIHLVMRGHHIKKKSVRKLIGVHHDDCEDLKYLNRYLFKDQLMVEDQRTPCLIHADALEILLKEMEKDGYTRPDKVLLQTVTYSESAFSYTPSELHDFKTDYESHNKLSRVASNNLVSAQHKTTRGKQNRATYESSDKGKRARATYDSSDKRKRVRATYDSSDKGKLRRATYESSDKGKRAQSTYASSDKGKRAQSTYASSDKGKRARSTYASSDKAKQTRAKYASSDKGKEAQARATRKWLEGKSKKN